MKNMLKLKNRSIKIITSLSIALNAGLAMASYDDGVQALKRGDTTKAVKEWTIAAQSGEVKSQTALGKIYYQQGDYKEALSWYVKAADKGSVEAHSTLGLMTGLGLGGPKNIIESYKWLSLAALRGDKDALRLINITREQMTPSEEKEAHLRAAKWIDAHPSIDFKLK